MATSQQGVVGAGGRAAARGEADEDNRDPECAAAEHGRGAADNGGGDGAEATRGREVGTMGEQELRALVQKYFGDLGPEVVELMFRVLLAESSGQVGAVGDNYKSGHQAADSPARYDYGLFQINSQHGYDSERLLSDPDYNAQPSAPARLSTNTGNQQTVFGGGG